MSIRIIDYKKIEMTEDEYVDYQKICKSYDRPNFKGEDLFKGLFETNDDGLIVYIKTLGNRQFSFEIVFFIMNLMQNQWLRSAMNNVNLFLKEKNEELTNKLKLVDEKITELDNKLASINKDSSP